MKKSTLWKRLLCALLLLGTACGAACSTVACTKPDSEPDDKDEPKPPLYDTLLEEVIVTAGEDRLAVNFCREDVVHFRYAPGGADFVAKDAVPESIAKYDNEYEPVHGVIEQTDTQTVLRTEGIVVAIDKATLGITVTDAESGAVVFQSAAEAFSADGAAKKASFVRDSAGEEHFFGLGNARGDSFTTTDHRNTVYDLWMHDDNVHAIIPLWYSTSGYGIYLNNSNRGSISFKQDYHLSVEDGEMNFYFLYGPSFKTILTSWSELAGRMNMPPLYALGLTYRGFGQWSEEQLLEALTAQLDAGISIDIAGVEPGWQTKTYPCTYAWAPKFTDDAASFVETMHALGLHVNLWEHPYVSPDATIYEDILEYSLKGTEIGTRDWEGRSGGTYGFGGIVPDLTVEEARELYRQIHDENLLSIGVDGFKVDETDSWGANNSLSLCFPGGLSNNAYHNLLGTLTVNLLHEQYRDDYNKRAFMFSRGNYSGMQRFATSAYTDYYGFDQFVMSVIAQSFSGTYYTPEIRDVSTPSDVDYMRRTQLMFLTPFAMSNEWATEASVLGRSRAVIECYKKYNALHYQLIPYMYSLFWEQYNTGIGVTRSLLMEFQDDPNVYGIDNQFMLGDALLVCPVSSSARVATVKLYLPAGERWMDYNTGYVYEGGKTIEYTCSAATLPLFVRMGSIIPLGHYGDNTADVIDNTLTLDIYPSEQSSTFTLYEDDGSTYDYQTASEYALTTLTSTLKDGKILCTVGARSGSYAVSSRACVLQLHYRTAPDSVKLDGKKLKAAASYDALLSSSDACYYYDASADDFDKIIYVRLTDDGKEHQIEVKVDAEPAQTAPGIVLEGTLYECEDGKNTLVGATVTRNKLYASGKAIVGSIGNNGKNTLTMNGIKVSESGTYEVEIIYVNGEEEPRMLYVSANGGEAIPVWCYCSGSWETPASIIVPLPLKAGENKLTFGTAAGKGWAPDLDHIIVYDDEPVSFSLGGEVLQPNDAEIVGSLTVDANAGAIGGKAASGFGGMDDTALRYTVSVAKAGPYQLNINYSNYSNAQQTLDLTINGQKTPLTLPSTQSTHLFSTLNMTVYLEAGENTIALGCDGGTTVYECEVGGDYHSCNNKLAPRDGYEQSGGYAVGATANNGAASFTMKGITVPEDDTYTVRIYIGSADTRTFRLKVNGEDTEELYSFRSGHYHDFKPFEVELDLVEGENTLTIWQDEPSRGDSPWLPNFDYVILPGVASQNPVRIGAISVQ